MEIATVGVVGGRQLARMMVAPAKRLGLRLAVLDPDAACSASTLADDAIVGQLDDYDALKKLASISDVLTFEIERVGVPALKQLQREGHQIFPSPEILETIQDKLTQKRFLVDAGVPTSEFSELDKSSLTAADCPFVWKARRDGYDGRGVAIVRELSDVASLPDGPALKEALVDIDYEVATQIARDRNGECVHFPLVDMDMDPEMHVMRRTIAPAVAPADVIAQTRQIAQTIANAMQFVGMLAIEFFVTRSGEVLVNELSPRPHNSAHYTIEACETSQFEQHLRAVAGLPLGPAQLTAAAVTFNVLGAPGATGLPKYIGFARKEDNASVFVHSYGKPQVRPGRKMGHATVTADSREAALDLAQSVEPTIKVESADE